MTTRATAKKSAPASSATAPRDRSLNFPAELKVNRATQSLKMQTVEKFRAALENMTFQSGDRLVDREISELFGVSRTIVREAMSQLQAEGLIQSIPHRGFIVAVWTREEIRCIYEVRASLEELIGRLFVQNASSEEKLEAERAIKKVIAAYRTKIPTNWMRAKAELYAILIKGGKNGLLEEMLRLIHGRVTMLRAITVSEPGRIKQSTDELNTILEAIRKNDPIAAAKAFRDHVEKAGAVAMEIMARKADEPSVTSSRKRGD